MGLPLRAALPILIVAGAVFLAVMGYLLKIGLGTPGTALGAGSTATAAPIARETDAPGTFAIPQSGTGPAGGTAPLPGQPAGQPVGAGGPPPAVAAMLAQLRARLAANPKDLAALVALGNLESDANKYDRALPYYRRALALDPSNPDVRTDEAVALHLTGHDLEALAELDTVIRSRPHFAPALFDRGVVLRAIGRREDARSAFEHFLKVAPNDARRADAQQQVTELRG